MSVDSLPGSFRFGPFQVDAPAGQLRKGGTKLRLAGQPLEILVMLLERPGHVVTREEIQQRLWPEQTFVDFENSLNKSINKLRQALSDSAEDPVYIETLPRRGYRFVGTLISTAAGEPKQESALVVDRPSNLSAATLPSLSVSRTHTALWRITSLCIFLALAVFAWFASHPLPPPRVIRVTQLTDSSRVDLYG